MKSHLALAFAAALTAAVASDRAAAQEREAIDGCIDAVRAQGVTGGEVPSSDYSQAATIVMLRDGSGTVWRCLGYGDGTVGEFTVAEADGDDGAMAGASEPTTTTERVRFAPGARGADLAETLSPGSSARYVLGATDGQFLTVRVAPRDPGLSSQIFNPDGSFLLEQMSPDREYRGQLWQSGDHVFEVINRDNAPAGYMMTVEIE